MIEDFAAPEAISAEERTLWHLGRDDFWRENPPERFAPERVLDAVEEVLWRLGGLDAVELWALDLGDKYRLDLVVKDQPTKFAAFYRIGNYAHKRVVGLCGREQIDAVAALWGARPSHYRRSNHPRYEGGRFALVSCETLACAVREAGKQPRDVYL